MLYLPVFWWHGVTGGAQRNMLVNWWCEMGVLRDRILTFVCATVPL